MIECVCIDDGNKPIEVPDKEWIEKGASYHITHVCYHPGQGIQGVYLREKKLSFRSFPYQTYAIYRFALTPENLERLIDMIEACSELNRIDISELLEESNLKTV